MTVRRTATALALAGLVAAPVALAAAPAHATEKDFRVAGAEVDYSVERDNGRYEVEVDVDDAKPGSTWRITLWHNGTKYFTDVRKANSLGDVRDVELRRNDTRGKDVFKVKVKRIGGAGDTRTITKR